MVFFVLAALLSWCIDLGTLRLQSDRDKERETSAPSPARYPAAHAAAATPTQSLGEVGPGSAHEQAALLTDREPLALHSCDGSPLAPGARAPEVDLPTAASTRQATHSC